MLRFQSTEDNKNVDKKKSQNPVVKQGERVCQVCVQIPNVIHTQLGTPFCTCLAI
jgi:hypothetical protein